MKRIKDDTKSQSVFGKEPKIAARKNLLLYIAVTAVLVCIFIAFGTLKKGYHVDELYTFSLSNHLYSLNDSIHMDFEDGTIYSGQELWDEFLTVRDGGSFDYANVYQNQTADVHPPLYYLFIHTVSSLVPSLSIKWIGLLVNILFDIIVYWQLVWMNCKLGIQKTPALVLSAFFVLGVGFVGYAVVFLRMYALLAVWINFLVMVFFANRPEEKGNIKYYLALGGTLFGGLFTQYYFMIFAFFACMVYAVFVIMAKNWKKLILSVVTAGATGGLWLLAWPAALTHIFGGYRGREAIENMLSGDLRENLWSYIDQINSGIFGGLAVVILAVLICLVIVASGKASAQEKDFKCTRGYQYALLVIPVCLYVIIIAKIAPYNTLRYVISLAALLYVAAFAAMINLASRVSGKGEIAIMLLAALVLFGGYRNEIANLYTSQASNLDAISAYEESTCLYLYDTKWRVCPNLQTIRKFDSVILMNGDDWQTIVSDLAGQSDEGSVVVYISDYLDLNQEDALAYIMDAYGLSESTQLFNFGYATCYVLQ